MTAPAPAPQLVDREARRALVEGRTDLEGIDFVEVAASDPRHRTLLVHLLNGAVDDEWHGDRVQVLGGVRADPAVNPVRVVWAHPALAIVDGSSAIVDGDWLGRLRGGVSTALGHGWAAGQRTLAWFA